MEANTINKRITTKINRDSLRLLRLIAAATGERLFAVIDRIVREEWARVEPSITSSPTASAPPRSDK